MDEIKQAWFSPIPLDEYQQLVSDNIPDKVKECPPDETVGKPSVSIVCGPNIRFLGCLELDKPIYRGTILLVLRKVDDGEQFEPPQINYVTGPASSTNGHESFSDGIFHGESIYQEESYVFFRYKIELKMLDYEQKVAYSINNEFRKDYQFFIPSVSQSMNVMSFSCNGFSLGADITTFKGSLWLEVLRRHQDFHYHVMLGGGDQIYSDSVKYASKQFNKWLRHKKTHSLWKMDDAMRSSLDHYYLNHYIDWFGKGYMAIDKGKTRQILFPNALHRIPQVNMFDDHDIIDGFGSYRDLTMRQDVFKGVGNSAYKYYMLFQQHTAPDENISLEPSWITGDVMGPYIHAKNRSVYARLGKEIALLALDCRTERTMKQLCTESTYSKVFARLTQEIASSHGEIKHLLVMLGVPICYPRMVWAEILMESRLLAPIKWMSAKGWILKGLVNEFDGSVELLDDLNDHWCSLHHKRERNKFMGRLLQFGASHGVRITILSGDVHLCCMTRFRSKIEDKEKEDPRFILNLISSAIVNTPPPNGMAGLLKKRSKIHRYDRNTVEDCVRLFTKKEGRSKGRGNDLFFNSRNFSDLIPVKNLSVKESKQYEGIKQGSLVMAGPSSDTKVIIKDGDKYMIKGHDETRHAKTKEIQNAYPLEDTSLVASLHAEMDRNDVSSNTESYQLLVPTLEHKVKLERVGKKL